MPTKGTETIATDPKRRFLCRHIFTDGHRCGSPALRGESLCYHHIRSRRQGAAAGRSGAFVLSHPDDRASIQFAIADVLVRIAAGDIDLKRGSTLLYGLQVASANLGSQSRAQAQAQPQPQVEDFTEDHYLGDLAPIAEIPAAHAETAAQQPATDEHLIGRDFSPDTSDRPNPGFSPGDMLSTSSASQTTPGEASTSAGERPESSQALDPSLKDNSASEQSPEGSEEYPELAPAEPSNHLPRPTEKELLRRRKPAFIHNSLSKDKDFVLYPTIRESLIFTPTEAEYAAAREEYAKDALATAQSAPPELAVSA